MLSLNHYNHKEYLCYNGEEISKEESIRNEEFYGLYHIIWESIADKSAIPRTKGILI